MLIEKRCNMVIECQKIEELSNPLLDKIEKTYNASFPESERRAFSLVRELVCSESRFSVYALFKEQEYVGFISAWHFVGFTYVEHFAIEASARNGGIGRIAIQLFMASCDGPIVLEVEMPTKEICARRIGFYERLGYVLDNHKYFQPPYRKGESLLEMRLMTYGKLDLNQSFEEVRDTIYRNVYRYQ